ncbi:MAG TPA: galactokinase [Kineosporiaceae bacterium]|nr:galactokinase [Kineosporiaceae bacterium]
MTGPAVATPVWYPLPTAEQAADDVTAAFVSEYGHPPDGVWAAPGRVNVIGEHVDYNAGLCLPFALPQRTFVALSARDDDTVRVRSLQVTDGSGPGRDTGRAAQSRWQGRLAEVAPGNVRGWAGYAVGVPWALGQAGLVVPGFDAVLDGYVPLGAGLSSSAALECAVAVALDDVAGLGLGADDGGRVRLAAACVRAENEMAGAPTGGLDQASSLRCLPGAALLLDCRDFSVEQVPLDLAAVGLQLLVMDTRAHHALVDGQYGDRRAGCEQACRELDVRSLREVEPDRLEDALVRLDRVEGGRLRPLVRHVVTEIARVEATVALLRADRVPEIGPLLDDSHASLRDDYRVSCPELDLACSTAVAAGALGARMVGGGFGGSAIALLEADRVDGAAGAVADAFEASGFEPPAFLRAVPSAGAGRVA